MEPKYYDYKKSPSNCYNLYRDGELVLKGVSEYSAWNWLHCEHSFSVGHALAHEGYSLQPCELLSN
jgi:hypothetical protein